MFESHAVLKFVCLNAAPPCASIHHLEQISRGRICRFREEAVFVMLIPAEDSRAQPAVDALHSGDVRSLKTHLEAHPELSRVYIGDTSAARTFLHILADWPGHRPNAPDSARVLVTAGADINAKFIGELHSETPLHWASSSGDIALIDALLDLGADIDAKGGVIAETPLSDARAFLQIHAAQRLVARGAKVSLQDAATLGLLGTVKQHYEDTQPSRSDTSCALWNACHGSQSATAKLLHELGGDVNFIPPWEPLTPLDAARRSGANDIVVWLESIGAVTASARLSISDQ